MAGIVVPTATLIMILTLYAYNRFYFEVSSQFVIPLPGAPLDLAWKYLVGFLNQEVGIG